MHETQAESVTDALPADESADYATALRLLRPMAERGDASAQFNLGLMYDHDLGVTQEYAQAVKWYRKAATQGHGGAQFNLGLMYEMGKGVAQDDRKAARWYREAADQDREGAQLHLGILYAEGRGVKQDYILAHKWLSLAAKSTTVFQQQANEVRDRITVQMTPAQIVKAERLARAWEPK